MAAMPSENVWNPAHMPNTPVDLIDKHASGPSVSAPALQSSLETADPNTSDPSPTVSIKKNGTGNTPLVAEEGAAELPKQDTSSEPGHAELGQNGDSRPNEPPSGGPDTPKKHLSNMSFTRTVSEDINWGADDEVEWDIQRKDTDPFKLMAQTDRTNSFPQVPPVHSATANAEPLHNQVEAIVDEVGQETKDLLWAEEHGEEDDFFAQQSSQGQESQDISGEQHHPSEVSHIDHGLIQGGEVQPEQDEAADARYEEGLPLVAANEGNVELSSKNDAFATEEDDAEKDDFFSQIANSEIPSKEPPALERKSTTQVVDSLNLPPPRTSINGSISQVPEDVDVSQPESNALSVFESGDGDLAEKWKAALAEDELLDDDDFLADDEPTESKALDPADLFGSDDEGFLEDEPDTVDSGGPNGSTSATIQSGFSAHSIPPLDQSRPASSRYMPIGATTTVSQNSNPYQPSGPVLTDISRSSTTSSVPLVYGSTAGGLIPGQEQPRRPEMPKVQSFAGQSKGGYSSPYDLPMDVVKPRKRVSMQQISHSYSTQPPPNVAPPRSASMNVGPPSRGPVADSSPPLGNRNNSQSSGATSQARPSSSQSKTGFFEDLPMSTRPKISARSTTSQLPIIQDNYMPAPPQYSQGPPPSAQVLVAPERVSPYASLGSNSAAPLPPATSRYSPAPIPGGTKATPPPSISQSRYSPAPPGVRQPGSTNPAQHATAPPPPILPHQPRTSSPLAHFRQEPGSSTFRPSLRSDRGSLSHESNLKPDSAYSPRDGDDNPQSMVLAGLQSSDTTLQQRSTHTPPPGSPHSLTSPPKRSVSNHSPYEQAIPPPRSQTQSPGTAASGRTYDANRPESFQRSASVAHLSTPSTPVGPVAHSRGASREENYAPPTDGREHDPMQRWKGAPLCFWGGNGTFITMFPQNAPRYGMGQLKPTILRSPGEVKVKPFKDLVALPEEVKTFPGPLKGKSKKKEVVTWLTSGISALEQNATYLRTASTLSHDDKRAEERILLWKILRVFIEHDGILEGNPVVDKAVRAVLSPNLDEDVLPAAAPLYATGSDLSGISQSSSTGTKADMVDPAAVDTMRKHLLRGDREKAVWEAVDKRLWAHALLISNTVSHQLYKQVAQEFIQKEVKNIGDNTEPLAALYEIFAGNFEESIDELVPPSARAGFQMISTSSAAGPSKDALDGLDRWRETLGLVLSNRSNDDSVALKALGKLLAGYGRAEAAHVCFLFARSQSVFGGLDNPAVNVVLLGSDHERQAADFEREIQPILLSEVYEFGLSLSGSSSASISTAHLAAYKLQHALLLAEHGYRDKALQYCDAIAASATSQTRRSPYHHALLVSEVENFSRCLKQSPKDEKSSWAKPSIEKVSTSVWSHFNKFVAGDESESATPGSAAGTPSDIGPFARIAGGTPTISRSPSNSELYGSYPGAMNVNGPLAKTSRYAPGFTSPQEQTTISYPGPSNYGSYEPQPRSSLEGRPSGELKRGPYEPARYGSESRPTSQPLSNSYTPQSYAPQSSSYAPCNNEPTYNESSYAPAAVPPNVYTPPPANSFDGEQPPPSYAPPTSSYEPPSSGYQLPTANPYEPSSSGNEQPSNGYEPPSSGYEPPSTGYEPPSSGYAPPSYEPGPMNEEPDSPITTRPKKSFMDDDGDDIPALRQQPETREKTKAEKDREADEAFRKAAEADAARAKESAATKKGWGLGGWFGGAKKEADMGAQPNKPIRAKLGEESSFVFDPELKRWVNKKAGAENTPASTPTPPPPRAGPPRPPSGAGRPGPPSAPPSTGPPQQSPRMNVSGFEGAENGGSDAPGMGSLPTPPTMARSVSNMSAGGPPITGPPSRPGTSMSNASSIDDLLGPATGARKGAVKGKKKGRGYVDVMGTKAS